MLARAVSRQLFNAVPAAASTAAPARFSPFAPLATRAFGGGNPRGHLRPSGMKIEPEDIENYHEPDLSMVNQGPPQTIVEERGQRWVVGESHRPLSDIFQIETKCPEYLPHWNRQRLRIYAGEWLLYKIEYLFAYIPTAIIFLLVMPAYCCVYAEGEIVNTTHVIKVQASQWYWVYDVESPCDDDDDDE